LKVFASIVVANTISIPHFTAQKQKRMVDFIETPVMVITVPGTGKTRYFLYALERYYRIQVRHKTFFVLPLATAAKDKEEENCSLVFFS